MEYGQKGLAVWTRRVKDAAIMEARKHQGRDKIFQKAEKESPALTVVKMTSDTPQTTISL